MSASTTSSVNRNTIIYLIGPPGVGKATIGARLAERLPAKLVDNHYWLNPIFGLIPQDGVTPLPKEIGALAARSRGVIMDTIISASPRAWNFIFTHAAVGIGEAYDRAVADDVKRVAGAREALLIAVQLTANADELARRVVLPERRPQMKETDAEAARRNAAEPPFDPGITNTVQIETTPKTPEETAEDILALIRRFGHN